MAICSWSSWSERPSNWSRGRGEAEEEGERKETPNLGKPVCRLWRQQQRDWAIAVVFDLMRFTQKSPQMDIRSKEKAVTVSFTV